MIFDEPTPRKLARLSLVDASGSMDWGEGEGNKYRFPLRLAAALGLIGLASGDQLTRARLQGEGEIAQYGPARGGHHTLGLLEFLEGHPAASALDLAQATQAFARAARRPGLAKIGGASGRGRGGDVGG